MSSCQGRVVSVEMSESSFSVSFQLQLLTNLTNQYLRFLLISYNSSNPWYYVFLKSISLCCSDQGITDTVLCILTPKRRLAVKTAIGEMHITKSIIQMLHTLLFFHKKIVKAIVPRGLCSNRASPISDRVVKIKEIQLGKDQGDPPSWLIEIYLLFQGLSMLSQFC